MEPKYHHKYLGWNARIDALQAALLRVKLPHLDRWLELRQQAAQRYDELIDEHQVGHFLRRPIVRPACKHTFNQYVVQLAPNERDGLMRHLKANQVSCDIYYPIPLHLQECLGHLGYGKGDFPLSEAACKTVLALPIFPEITPEQQHFVIQTCAEYVQHRGRRVA
jgi:dTDP-4-amino-4,6-dideoxygalactose transaminase